MTFKRLLITLFLLILLLPIPARSDSTTNVPIDDPVYRDIDKLVATGLVKGVIYGQRPWSRGEIARIVSEASKNHDLQPVMTPDSREANFHESINTTLERLKRNYKDELSESKNIRLRPLDKASVDYTVLDSPVRTVPVDNGLGNIDASVNPLVMNQEGRHFVDGQTLGIETTHRAQLSPYFSLYARPRLEILNPNTGQTDVNVVLQQAYGKFGYGKFELEVGRDSLAWGQGETGGLLFSNNARPLDMVKIGTSSPVYLPWFLKYLGPNSLNLFFADLGPEQFAPHAILSGYKWSLKPFHFWEIGVHHVVIMGGSGNNDPSVLEAIGEFSGILSAVTSNKGGTAVTNRLMSLDTRLVLPVLRNSAIYGEIAFDDTNSEKDVLLEDNATYYVGLYIPRLSDDGSVDLRLEYKHIPGLTYRHTLFQSGYTLNGLLLGDPLGPDGDQFDIKMGIQATDNTWLITGFTYEKRDSDTFTSITAGGDVIDIVATADNPAEIRWRFGEEIRWQITPKTLLDLTAGYEYVTDFTFVEGREANNFLGQAKLSISY